MAEAKKGSASKKATPKKTTAKKAASSTTDAPDQDATPAAEALGPIGSVEGIHGQEKLDEDGQLEGLGGAGDSSRTPRGAIQAGLKLIKGHSFVGVGLCLMVIRSLFGVPAKYRSAAEAWAAADVKHRVRNGDNIPRGVPVYWTGGSSGFGHIALSLGNGRVLSTDWKERGYVSVANIDELTARWGLNLAGWSPFVNDVRVWTPTQANPEPKPDPHEDDAAPHLRPRIREAMQLVAKARLVAVKEHPEDVDNLNRAMVNLKRTADRTDPK